MPPLRRSRMQSEGRRGGRKGEGGEEGLKFFSASILWRVLLVQKNQVCQWPSAIRGRRGGEGEEEGGKGSARLGLPSSFFYLEGIYNNLVVSDGSWGIKERGRERKRGGKKGGLVRSPSPHSPSLATTPHAGERGKKREKGEGRTLKRWRGRPSSLPFPQDPYFPHLPALITGEERKRKERK